MFFDDEVNYYEIAYAWNVKYEFPRQVIVNKPYVIKNVYRDGDMPCEMHDIETMIKNEGFILKRQSRLAECERFEPSKKILDLYGFSKKLIGHNGMKIGVLTPDLVEAFRRFQTQIPLVPYYELQYFSDDELIDQSKHGNLIIVSQEFNSEICGYSHVYYMGKYMCGVIAVKDEYLDAGGVTLALSAEAYKRDMGKQVHRIGWIGDDNTASIRYHKKMGWVFTNKRMNEWVKEVNDE